MFKSLNALYGLFFFSEVLLVSLDLPLWISNALFFSNKYKCNMHLRFFKEVRKASETVEALSLCYILHDSVIYFMISHVIYFWGLKRSYGLLVFIAI